MFSKTSPRFIVSLVVSGLLTAPGTAVLAATQTTQTAPAATPVELNAAPTWRRWAMPLAVAGTGLALAGTVAAMTVNYTKTNEFNRHNNGTCNSSAPDKGGPECAALLKGTRTATRWRKISLGATAGFAATALVLWFTRPDPLPEPSRAANAFRIACAPGFGPSASCALTF